MAVSRDFFLCSFFVFFCFNDCARFSPKIDTPEIAQDQHLNQRTISSQHHRHLCHTGMSGKRNADGDPVTTNPTRTDDSTVSFVDANSDMLSTYPYYRHDVWNNVSVETMIETQNLFQSSKATKKVMDKYKEAMLDVANASTDVKCFSLPEMSAVLCNARSCMLVNNLTRDDESELLRKMLQAQQLEISRLHGRTEDSEDACEIGVCEGGKKIWVQELPKEMRCACKEKVAACMLCWSKACAEDEGRCPFCRTVLGVAR